MPTIDWVFAKLRENAISLDEAELQLREIVRAAEMNLRDQAALAALGAIMLGNGKPQMLSPQPQDVMRRAFGFADAFVLERRHIPDAGPVP